MMIENSKYLLDTSAWIEYFLGTKKGEKVQTLFASSSTIITITPSLGELFYWALKNKHDFQLLLLQIRNRSRIIELSTNNWVEAAHKKLILRPTKQKIGLIDTTLLSVQEMTGAIIVTKDNDFCGLPNTIML